jgi:hypothetical protein
MPGVRCQRAVEWLWYVEDAEHMPEESLL